MGDEFRNFALRGDFDNEKGDIYILFLALKS